MRSPLYELAKAYKTALTGQITYNSQTVLVYNRVPNRHSRYTPYIQIHDSTSSTDFTARDKDLHGYDTTTLIEIYTEFPIKSGSSKPSLEIADQVLQIVGVDLPLDTLKITDTTLDSSIENRADNDVDLAIIRLLRIRNQVKEL